MPNEIQKEIQKLIAQKDQKEQVTRINVTLGPSENRRTEFIAKHLNVSKQLLIERLFAAGLKDLEKELGFEFSGDYLEMIHSEEPVSAFVDIVKPNKYR